MNTLAEASYNAAIEAVIVKLQPLTRTACCAGEDCAECIKGIIKDIRALKQGEVDENSHT